MSMDKKTIARIESFRSPNGSVTGALMGVWKNIENEKKEFLENLKKSDPKRFYELKDLFEFQPESFSLFKSRYENSTLLKYRRNC